MYSRKKRHECINETVKCKIEEKPFGMSSFFVGQKWLMKSHVKSKIPQEKPNVISLPRVSLLDFEKCPFGNMMIPKSKERMLF